MKTQVSQFSRSLYSIVIPLFTGLGMMAIPEAIANPAVESDPSLQLAQTASIIEGSWRLTNMTEPGSPMPQVPVQPLTAEFGRDRVAGSGGCNRFSGGFTTKGNELKIGSLASTFKACSESIMRQESKYLKALQASRQYTVHDQGLEISYETDQGSGVMRFIAQGVRALW